MFEVFGDVDPAEQEAEERWGDTDAYRGSARRARRNSRDDWARYKSESDAVTDARFTATYEKVRAGMALYLSDAIAANAARALRG